MEEKLTYYCKSNLVDQNKFKIKERVALFPYPCRETDNCAPISITLQKGVYRFELWGGNGGDSRRTNSEVILKDSGGKSSFVSGILEIPEQQKFFLYIGGKGEDQSSIERDVISKGGYNGGGNGGIDESDEGGATDPPESSAGGGGATDVRLINGTTLESLASRIIVAAGGGGAQSAIYDKAKGGHGGTLVGLSTNEFTSGGTQNNRSFGKGDDGFSFSNYLKHEGDKYGSAGGSSGGCGGGYYGGFNNVSYEEVQNLDIEHGGAGGSSYVSGCFGCESVRYDEANDSIQNTSNKYHPSLLVFSHIKMKSGEEPVEKPIADDNGNGLIRIIYLQPYNPSQTQYYKSYNHFLITLIMYSYKY